MEIYSYAKTKPLDLRRVKITGGFWQKRIEQSRTVGLPRLLSQYEDRNIVKNFIAVSQNRPRDDMENGRNYDEFLFKALEAAAYYLGESELPEWPNDDAQECPRWLSELKSQYRRIRDIVLSAQQPDGYLNTLAVSSGTEHFTPECVQEMYAGGHLMQAGIADYRGTGNRILFKAAKKYVDRIIQAFNEEGRQMWRHNDVWKWPDHPNFESALIELYRVTGERKYIEFCNQILDFAEYRDRTQILNHAVCEMLHAAGGTDYYLETGDTEVWKTTQCLWADMIKKVYVTGAIGAAHTRGTSEAVGKEHYLTNIDSYAETCASVSSIFWNWRMFLATAECKYVDMLERALYNAVIAGIAENGYEYFYQNPHEYKAVTSSGSGAVSDTYADSRGANYQRNEHIGCSCCPPNVQRLFASLQQYIYAVKDDAIWINLFIDSEMRHQVPGGPIVTLKQKTEYPWDGKVLISMGIENERAAELSIKVRVPEWCEDAEIKVNGEIWAMAGEQGDDRHRHSGHQPATYVEIKRDWAHGDNVELSLPMDVRLLRSHPKNIANYGKVVIARGPVIYCLESTDNPDVDIFCVELPEAGAFADRYDADLLGGVVVLEGAAWERDDRWWDTHPYPSLGSTHDVPDEDAVKGARIKAIPYFAWANRGRCSMITAFPLSGGQ